MVIAALSCCAVASFVSIAGRGWASGAASVLVLAAILAWRRLGPPAVPLSVIVGLGVALRIGWIVAFPTEVELDFASYHRFATQLAAGEHGPLLYAKLLLQEVGYPLVLSGAYVLAGADAGVGRGLNVLFAAWLIVVVYRVLVPAGEKAALSGALMIAVWPSHVALSSVLASENLFLPLVWSGVGAALQASRREQVMGGALLGAAHAVRPPAALLLGLLVVGSALRRRWSSAVVMAVAAVLAFASYLGVRRATGDPFPRGAFGYSVLMGSNVGSVGTWNVADHTWFLTRRTEAGVSAANSEAVALAATRLAESPAAVPALVARKVGLQWGDGAVGVDFALRRLERPGADLERWRGPAMALADVAALVIWLFALHAVVVGNVLRQHPLAWLAGAALTLAWLSHLVLEANPRYAMPWFVGVIVLAALRRNAPLTKTP